MTTSFHHEDHSGDAGFIFQSRRTGAVVYRSAAQGFDDSDGGRYTIVCTHGRLVTVSAQRAARGVAAAFRDAARKAPAAVRARKIERRREQVTRLERRIRTLTTRLATARRSLAALERAAAKAAPPEVTP